MSEDGITNALSGGLEYDTTRIFHNKVGRQALVLINYLLENQNQATEGEIFERFTWNDGFASDSTVDFELERLTRKGIIEQHKSGVRITKQFLSIIDMLELDISDILANYLAPSYIRCAPIFIRRNFQRPSKPFAFVLMPFSDKFFEIYTDHIKPTIEGISDFQCIRSDEIFKPEPIMETVWEKIFTATVIISDLTSKNPNVFYETGIAHTIGKTTILLSQDIEDVPFDLRHLKVILYKPTYRGCLDLREKLLATLKTEFHIE